MFSCLRQTKNKQLILYASARWNQSSAESRLVSDDTLLWSVCHSNGAITMGHYRAVNTLGTAVAGNMCSSESGPPIAEAGIQRIEQMFF